MAAGRSNVEIAGGALLDQLLGVPAAVLVGVGGFLVAYAAALWLIGARPR